MENKKKIEYLVVDTTAFLQNASLLDLANNIVTCQEVIDEIKNKRQLRRLVVLPYELKIKDVFPENVQIITEFSKKTGDYPSLSATDIKVMALTYQLEKEFVGTEHLKTTPVYQPSINLITKGSVPEVNPKIAGFFVPNDEKNINLDELMNNSENNQENDETNVLDDINELEDKFRSFNCDTVNKDDETKNIDGENEHCLENEEKEDILEKCDSDVEDDVYSSEEDDDSGWITPMNVKAAKKQVQSEGMEEKEVQVACMTTDFAMQNVLKQMNLNVSALDGKMIKHLRTFILRCYTCFKTTSIMTKRFCPKCGNDTLKKVAISLDEKGEIIVHINTRRPLTARGKKFSLPKIKGGKHPNNPILVEDQPIPENRPTRLARTKNNPMDSDYIAGFSPFVTRDVNSKSAQLCIRPDQQIKYWMRKNPNEARRKRK